MYYIGISKNNKFLFDFTLNPSRSYSIGRHTCNDICFGDDSLDISRFHAALFPDTEGNVCIQDLGSINGIFINSAICCFKKLVPGDIIQIGNYELKFSKAEEPLKKNKNVKITVGVEFNVESTRNDNFKISKKDISFEKDILILIYEINRILNNSDGEENIITNILSTIAKKFKADRVLLGLINNPEDIKCLGVYPDNIKNINISKSILKYITETNDSFISDDALSDERLFNKYGKNSVAPESIKISNVRSVVCVPYTSSSLKRFLYIDSSENKSLFDKKNIIFFSNLIEDISCYLNRIDKKLNYENEIHKLENLININNEIVGNSPLILKIKKDIQKIASTEMTVLITGESGTGKDILAKTIHNLSNRKDYPFIEINCPAIPPTLLETEMFGVVANYPGFHNNQQLLGKFHLADKGTVFLNEIGDMSLELQSKLLEVLEKKMFWQLGAERPTSVNIRIIAATNHNLIDDIKSNKFRSDLYERLNMFAIDVPPLRNRKEDIPFISGYFLCKFRNEYNKLVHKFSNSAINLLTSYDWPRNIRELKNSIERAIILTDNKILSPELFDFIIQDNKSLLPLAEIEKSYITKVLSSCNGNKEKSAKILGITKQTLYNKLKDYSIINEPVS